MSDNPCGHDARFGLIGLPKEANGCLACHVEQIAAENAALKARLAEAERDSRRLQWLADNPRGAQIVVDGKTQDCVFWGISAHPRATLREAIDAAMGTADQPSVAQPWDRECVKCGCKWIESGWGAACPRCEGNADNGTEP